MKLRAFRQGGLDVFPSEVVPAVGLRPRCGTSSSIPRLAALAAAVVETDLSSPSGCGRVPPEAAKPIVTLPKAVVAPSAPGRQEPQASWLASDAKRLDDPLWSTDLQPAVATAWLVLQKSPRLPLRHHRLSVEALHLRFQYSGTEL